jgi:CubicO group peptidase (beta-lactamase class C family)
MLLSLFTCLIALRALIPPGDSTVQRLARERVESNRNVGIVIGIIDSIGRRRLFQFGKATDDASAPLGANTVFEIGSVTKTFTAALLEQMVEHDEVSLDEPASTLLPADVHVAAHGREITLLDLSTQGSGLPSLPANFRPANPEDPYVDYGATQLHAFLSGFAPSRDPGVQYEYSNVGVGLLGYVLSRRANASYEQALTDRVLKPLGMSDTRVTPTTDMARRLATGHNRDGDAVPAWHFDALAGAGALRSTLNDMLTFLAANMDSTRPPLGATLHATHQSRRTTTVPNTTIGLNWHILHAHNTSIVWHNGETAGFHSFIGFDPSRHVGVVVLSNSATSIDDLGFHLIDERNELRPPPEPPAEAPQDTLMLERYAGAYELAPGVRLTVTRTGGKLHAQISGQQRFRIFATSDSTFRWTVVDAQVIFRRDASGAVAGALFRQGGRDIPLRRIP